MMLAQQRVLSLPFVPGSWKRIGRAVTDFRRYMEEMLEKENSYCGG